ncbi:hypothetical protein Tco_1070168 [Tanacetum coccineum]|uniref:Uncharacterized protein n=1 Tax=Tanacetum coccineum TaxID=301880 RepID=A0ABQ5HM25_9ASTR
MVKHDVEVESSGECVDKIDKLTEVSMKLINIDFSWKALENDVYCFDVQNQLNGFRGSHFNIFLSLLLHPQVIEGQKSGPFQQRA